MARYTYPYFLPLNPSSFWWPATIMGYRRNVSNAGNVQPGSLQRADGRLSTGAWPFDIHVNLAQTHVHTAPGCLLGGSLGCEGCAFAGTLKSRDSGARRCYHVAVGISDTDQCIVECRVNIRPSLGNDSTFSTTTSRSGHNLLLASSASASASYGSPWPFSGASVGSSSLPVNWQTSPMPDAPIRPDFD
jgi:hypothetical protein